MVTKHPRMDGNHECYRSLSPKNKKTATEVIVGIFGHPKLALLVEGKEEGNITYYYYS